MFVLVVVIIMIMKILIVTVIVITIHSNNNNNHNSAALPAVPRVTLRSSLHAHAYEDGRTDGCAHSQTSHEAPVRGVKRNI